MILGFAHLAVSAANIEDETSRWIQSGWVLRDLFRRVPSAPEKWALLASRPQSHDLAILHGTPPIEVVVHDSGTVEGAARLTLGSEGKVTVLARDALTEQVFFCRGLGFESTGGNLLKLNSRFEQWRINLMVKPSKSSPLDPPLDLCGFGCLAFYSTDVVADSKRLLERGGHDATEPFDIKLGDRRMTVLMLRSPEGTIIELIKIKAKS
jgi:hypothetical protein